MDRTGPSVGGRNAGRESSLIGGKHLAQLDGPDEVAPHALDRSSIRAAGTLEAATCTIPIGLDRTAIGADEVRPARWIPAVHSFGCLRFHRSPLSSQLLFATNRIETTEGRTRDPAGRH